MEIDTSSIDTTRHSDHLEGVSLERAIVVVGCGSIGTAFATTMARIGFNSFILIDDDTVEAHNIANQYFESTDIGKMKTTALTQKLRDINPSLIAATFDKKADFAFLSDVPLHAIIAMCVDDMDTRRLLLPKPRKDVIYIDGRMGSLNGMSICFKLGRKKAYQTYEKTLYKDTDVPDVPCTARSVIHTITMTSSVMAGQALKACKNEISYSSVHVDMDKFIVAELLSL